MKRIGVLISALALVLAGGQAMAGPPSPHPGKKGSVAGATGCDLVEIPVTGSSPPTTALRFQTGVQDKSSGEARAETTSYCAVALAKLKNGKWPELVTPGNSPPELADCQVADLTNYSLVGTYFKAPGFGGMEVPKSPNSAKDGNEYGGKLELFDICNLLPETKGLNVLVRVTYQTVGTDDERTIENRCGGDEAIHGVVGAPLKITAEEIAIACGP
jgi:hypothetical protein